MPRHFAAHACVFSVGDKFGIGGAARAARGWWKSVIGSRQIKTQRFRDALTSWMTHEGLSEGEAERTMESVVRTT